MSTMVQPTKHRLRNGIKPRQGEELERSSEKNLCIRWIKSGDQPGLSTIGPGPWQYAG